MTLARPAHGQCRIHVDVVRCQIQTDQALEENAPSGERGGEIHEQASGRASIGHHIQDGAELGGLLKVSCCDPIERVQQAGYAVEERAGPRVNGHVIQRGDGEDDSRVACRSQLSKGVMSGLRWDGLPMRLGMNVKMFSSGSAEEVTERLAPTVPFDIPLPSKAVLPFAMVVLSPLKVYRRAASASRAALSCFLVCPEIRLQELNLVGCDAGRSVVALLFGSISIPLPLEQRARLYRFPSKDSCKRLDLCCPSRCLISSRQPANRDGQGQEVDRIEHGKWKTSALPVDVVNL